MSPECLEDSVHLYSMILLLHYSVRVMKKPKERKKVSRMMRERVHLTFCGSEAGGGGLLIKPSLSLDLSSFSISGSFSVLLSGPGFWIVEMLGVGQGKHSCSFLAGQKVWGLSSYNQVSMPGPSSHLTECCVPFKQCLHGQGPDRLCFGRGP